MIRLGVIGLGTIFSTQIAALESLSGSICLSSVFDIDAEKYSVLSGRGISSITPSPVKYCADAADMVENAAVDTILISTPPATHFELARKALLNNKSVLLEKPATLDFSELEILYLLANRHNTLLHIAYHASFAKDLEWYLANEKGMRKVAGELLDLEHLAAIECNFFDPYIENNVVIERKRPLGGCFIDSGVNALSVCSRLVDLSTFYLDEKEECKESCSAMPTSDPESRLVIGARHTFSDSKRTIVINTSWEKGLNHKSTLLSFAGTDSKILLNHSDQAVALLRDNRYEVLYTHFDHTRLLTHYQGVFTDYYKAYKERNVNEEMTRHIHRLLLS